MTYPCASVRVGLSTAVIVETKQLTVHRSASIAQLVDVPKLNQLMSTKMFKWQITNVTGIEVFKCCGYYNCKYCGNRSGVNCGQWAGKCVWCGYPSIKYLNPMDSEPKNV